MPEVAPKKSVRTVAFEPTANGAVPATGELRYVKGIGPKKAEALAKAGFESVDDLIYHFPGRYLDARQLVPLRDLRKFLRQPVSVRGKVLSAKLLPGRHR